MSIYLFTRPEGVSIVSTGAADVADEPPEDRASHDAAIAGLQVVRAGQNNSTKFGNSILGGEEVSFKIAAQSSFDKNITCRILQARHCGSRDCSASLLFRS